MRLARPRRGRSGSFLPLGRSNRVRNSCRIARSAVCARTIRSIRLLGRTNGSFSRRTVTTNGLAPIFFNSTLANFNIRAFLSTFISFTPDPDRRLAITSRVIRPASRGFANFVFGVRTGVGPTRQSEVTFIHIYSNRFGPKVSIFIAHANGGVGLTRAARFVTSSHRRIRATMTNSVVKLCSAKGFRVNSAVRRNGGTLRFRTLPRFAPRLFVGIAPGGIVGRGSFRGKIRRLIRRKTVRLCGACRARSCVLNTINRLRFRIFRCHLLRRCGTRMRVAPVNSGVTQ